MITTKGAAAMATAGPS